MLNWSPAALDSASLPAKRGGRDVAKPDGSRQAGHEAPPRHGCQKHASRPDADRSKLSRQPHAGHHPRHGAGRAQGVVVARGAGPDKLHADTSYDHRRCRRECQGRSITPRIARRSIESSEHLGRYRWIVERTLSRLARFPRLAIRYERRADLHLAFTTIACAFICRAQLKRFYL